MYSTGPSGGLGIYANKDQRSILWDSEFRKSTISTKSTAAVFSTVFLGFTFIQQVLQ